MGRDWQELPAELTASILERIGAFDLLSARQVCKSWRAICSEPHMWRVLDMRNLCDKDRDVENMVRTVVDLSRGHLVQFSMEFFAYNDTLFYISNRSSQLRHLCLVSCTSVTNGGLSKMVKKLPLLEELHLYDCCISKEAIEVAGRCCPRLKSFKLNQRYSGSYIGRDNDALAIAENMRGLSHLELIGNTIERDGLLAIIENCRHLQTLDIRQCLNVANLEPDLVRRLSQQIKDLRLPYDSTEDYEFNYLDSSDEDDPSCWTIFYLIVCKASVKLRLCFPF